MKDLLDKLSSYNLFNYLLPGTIFVAAAEQLSTHRFTRGNVVVDAFLYYFIGLVISRFGSLAIGPLLQATKFVKFAPYKAFVTACDSDPKIDLLSEQNNMFRTLIALFATILAFAGLDQIAIARGISENTALLVTCAGLVVLFAFAYRKQTDFVRKRVEVRSK